MITIELTIEELNLALGNLRALDHMTCVEDEPMEPDDLRVPINAERKAIIKQALAKFEEARERNQP